MAITKRSSQEEQPAGAGSQESNPFTDLDTEVGREERQSIGNASVSGLATALMVVLLGAILASYIDPAGLALEDWKLLVGLALIAAAVVFTFMLATSLAFVRVRLRAYMQTVNVAGMTLVSLTHLLSVMRGFVPGVGGATDVLRSLTAASRTRIQVEIDAEAQRATHAARIAIALSVVTFTVLLALGVLGERAVVGRWSSVGDVAVALGVALAGALMVAMAALTIWVALLRQRLSAYARAVDVLSDLATGAARSVGDVTDAFTAKRRTDDKPSGRRPQHTDDAPAKKRPDGLRDTLQGWLLDLLNERLRTPGDAHGERDGADGADTRDDHASHDHHGDHRERGPDQDRPSGDA